MVLSVCLPPWVTYGAELTIRTSKGKTVRWDTISENDSNMCNTQTLLVQTRELKTSILPQQSFLLESTYILKHLMTLERDK